MCLIRRHYRCVKDYVDYLADTLQRRPASIHNFTIGLIKVGKWFHYHLDEDIYPYHITDKQWNRFKDVTADIGNCFRRKAKKLLGQRSMGVCVENREVPPNGQQGLLDPIRTVVPWVQSFDADDHPYITKGIYLNMNHNLAAAIYACSPQGRIGGIMSLRYKHAKKLLSNGYVLATDFKTAETYITQPVILLHEALLFFRVYMERFRVYAAEARSQRFQVPINQPEDPLFLTWTGEEEKNLGRYIKAFYVKNADLIITTTKVRSLIETTAEDLGRAGVIDGITREGVREINGHSSAICKAHYNMRNRERDVVGARELMAVIRGEHRDTVESNSTASPSASKRRRYSNVTILPQRLQHEYENGAGCSDTVYTRPVGRAPFVPEIHPVMQHQHSRLQTPVIQAATEYEQIDWGRLHPDYGKLDGPNSRFVWTDAELEYIQRYVDSHGGPYSYEICARMLQHIKTTGFTEAKDIFHKKHVLTSARLRHGVRRVFHNGNRRIQVRDNYEPQPDFEYTASSNFFKI